MFISMLSVFARSACLTISITLCFTLSISAYATQYFSLPEVQAQFYPGAEMTPLKTFSAAAYQRGLSAHSGPINTTWVAKDKGRVLGWVVAEHVIGKHDYIDFAVGISPQGRITGFEVMNYRESYGGQVRSLAWRQQFIGRQVGDALTVGNGVQSISGATLSATHLAEAIGSLMRYHHDLLLPSVATL
jgi:Na+-translocating ferredoxin:NAD+ oxidoreductase RnfG subunit